MIAKDTRHIRHLRQRSMIIRRIRDYFHTTGMMEVDTPILRPHAAMEEHLQPVSCLVDHPLGEDTRYFLHPSPETAMKTLLSYGSDDIFQIGHVFRNREHSPLHRPEFTMVEWYRKNAGLEDLFRDCAKIVQAAVMVTQKKHWQWHHVSCDVGSCDVGSCDAESCDVEAPILPQISVAQAFFDYCRIDIMATIDDPLLPDPRLLSQQAEKIGIRCAHDDFWDDIFFRILTDRIEPHLGCETPVFLTDYPTPLAIWAKPNPTDPRLSLRAEMFIAGIEIANGFDELLDLDECLRRVDSINIKRKERGKPALITDHGFIDSLRRGLPPCAGMALGLDRIVMLACGADDIHQIIYPHPD